MAAPVVVSTSPQNNDTGVVLRTVVSVLFDQPLKPETVSSATVSLLGPPKTKLLTPDRMVDPTKPYSGSEVIPSDIRLTNSNTRIELRPRQPLEPNTRYRVILLGGSGIAGAQGIANPAGEVLAKTYLFSFTTGDLDLATPPAQNPLQPGIQNTAIPDILIPNWMRPKIRTESVIVRPPDLGDGIDLPATVEIEFPADIDVNSFNPQDLIVALLPVVNDPLVQLPADLTYSVSVSGKKLLITIQLPSSP